MLLLMLLLVCIHAPKIRSTVQVGIVTVDDT
jgi:hypothetical protein